MMRKSLNFVYNSNIFFGDNTTCLTYLFFGFFILLFILFIRGCITEIQESKVEKYYEKCTKDTLNQSQINYLDNHTHIPTKWRYSNIVLICPSESTNDLYYVSILVEKYDGRSSFWTEWVFVIGFYNQNSNEITINKPFAINKPANDYLDFGKPGIELMSTYGNDGATKALHLILDLAHGYNLKY